MIPMITDFPLYIFTSLTGLAAGVYVAACLFPKKNDSKPSIALPLAALVLAGVGGVASSLHLGRPELVLSVLNNPGSSITLEAFGTGAFALFVLVDLILVAAKHKVSRPIRTIAAVMGIVLMIIEAHAYATMYGNPAFTQMSTWFLFVCISIACGFAMLPFFDIQASESKNFRLAACALLVVAAIVFIWEAAVFADFDKQIMQVVCGAVLACIAGALYTLPAAGKNSQLALFASAIAVAALLIGRYGFYLAALV